MKACNLKDHFLARLLDPGPKFLDFWIEQYGFFAIFWIRNQALVSTTKRRTTFKAHLMPMGGNHENDEDLSAFLEGFGFSEEELRDVVDELEACRSIPGTTLARYLNRVLNTIAHEERSAFLKGIMLGVAIKKAVDAVIEPDLTAEEKEIDGEIERLGLNRR